MNKYIRDKLLEFGGENVRFDVPMSLYSTIRAGGSVDAMFIANDLGSLKKVITFLHKKDVPYLVVGKCSNILVKDNGFRGIVITLGKEFSTIYMESPNSVAAGGGLKLSRLIEYCKKKGLSGLEFLCGIPGAIGGAISMNAGA